MIKYLPIAIVMLILFTIPICVSSCTSNDLSPDVAEETWPDPPEIFLEEPPAEDFAAATGLSAWVKDADLKYNRENGAAVYFTADISPEGLVRIYQALNAEPQGNIAVKLSTGQPGSNYLRPELIKLLVQSLEGVIVECNTIDGGNRYSTEYHLQVAKDHGFTDIAEFDIMDSAGEITLPVVGGEVLRENFVGSHFINYDYFVVLSHFKGHPMAGFGGAIKNIAIGIASKSGKGWIHSGGTKTSGAYCEQDIFLKCMAEAGKSVSDSLDGSILYINVMNRLSIDCDCIGNPREPDMHDIGILSSFDPVALDQACVDLVSAAPDSSARLLQRIEQRNGLLTLEHAAMIGLGAREYTLVIIDE